MDTHSESTMGWHLGYEAILMPEKGNNIWNSLEFASLEIAQTITMCSKFFQVRYSFDDLDKIVNMY